MKACIAAKKTKRLPLQEANIRGDQPPLSLVVSSLNTWRKAQNPGWFVRLLLGASVERTRLLGNIRHQHLVEEMRQTSALHTLLMHEFLSQHLVEASPGVFLVS